LGQLLFQLMHALLEAGVFGFEGHGETGKKQTTGQSSIRVATI
jgi:hypothetical protein